VSELLGKATIDTNTFGRSFGRNGNYSKNDQNAGRELLTPDEVRLLDNRYALLFIRGERPIMDDKYDILRHPNVGGTADGRAKPYAHNEDRISYASLGLADGPPPPGELPPQNAESDIFCDEDADQYFNELEREPS
jgi:type IV secretion system protein VirD4